MTNPPKRPLARDDDSWGKLASDLFGIEFGVDDELDLPDPDELNVSIPTAAAPSFEEPLVERVPAANPPTMASTTTTPRKKVIDDTFGSDLFDSDIVEEVNSEEFVEVAEVRETIPASNRRIVRTEEPGQTEAASEETEDSSAKNDFPMTIAEQGDDYWDALENWSWDEPQGKSRESRPKDLLKTLEAEVARNSRHARDLADTTASGQRSRRSPSATSAGAESERSGRGSSSSSRDDRKSRPREGISQGRKPQSIEGKSDEHRTRGPREESQRTSGQPRPRRVDEERLPAVDHLARLSADDDEFGSGLSESAGSVERSSSRRLPRSASQPRRPLPSEVPEIDEELADTTEIDDVAFVAESSEVLEDGEVRRRRRRRRRRRPGGRSTEATRDPLAAEEFGTDSDELEEHLEDSRSVDTDEPEMEFSERELPAPRPERSSADKPSSDRTRRPHSSRRSPRERDERSDRPPRPARTESARGDSPRVRKEGTPEVADRDNEFVEEPRRRSRRPVTDENYMERPPRDLEVPPSRRPVAAASQAGEELAHDPITPANYDDIPTWEEAIGLLVKTPSPSEGDRSSRPRRDDHRRGDRYRN